MSQSLTTQITPPKSLSTNKSTAKIATPAVSDVALRALQSSSIDAFRRVDVSQIDGNHLVLSGRVSTFYLKQQAQELVRQAVRNAELVNDIEVY